MRQGFEDANEEVESLLSCPVCWADKWLANSPGPGVGSDYYRGYRMQLIFTTCLLKHECGK